MKEKAWLVVVISFSVYSGSEYIDCRQWRKRVFAGNKLSVELLRNGEVDKSERGELSVVVCEFRTI